MRVVQCNTVADRGGAAKIAVNLCEGLGSIGNEVTLVYGRGSQPRDITSVKIQAEIESKYYAMRCRLFDDDGFSANVTTKRLINFLNEKKPDVFHLHNAHGYYLNIKMLFEYLYENKIPVVWTIHDYWPITGHCPFYSLGNCDKWRNGTCNNCILKTKYPRSYFYDKSREHYLAKKDIFENNKNIVAVAPSLWVLSHLNESPINIATKVHIPNGVDTNVFTRTHSSIKTEYNIEDKIVILGVANGWGVRKGLNDFIELASRLSKDYQIVMVGFTKIPDNLPSNITPIGRIGQKKLIEWYSAADVYVSLSRDETFGLTSIEALSCGTPIIQYNTTTSGEIINESCGRICDGLEGIIHAIEELSNTNLIEDCVKRAKLFSIENMTRKYANLYEMIVS